jgi:alanyl-tRNA synthetase
MAKILGGSGGGSKDFAQGGGPKTERMKEASEAVFDTVSGLIGR